MNRVRVLLALLAVSLCWSMAAQAQDTLTYQGQMLNAARQPITASYPMVFKLYAEREEGDVLWTESYESVDVLDGTSFKRNERRRSDGFSASVSTTIATGHNASRLLCIVDRAWQGRTTRGPSAPTHSAIARSPGPAVNPV